MQLEGPIVTAGDPVLRGAAKPVPPEALGTPELTELVERMVEAMRGAPGVGLAAPQIGVDLRVIVVEDRPEYGASLSADELRARERTPVELTVVVNPVLALIGTATATFFEGCLSVPGYVALVERHLEVEVTGSDARGAPVVWRARGWPARILQHELDHLDGTLYVDRMLTRSFCTTAEAPRWLGRPATDVKAALRIR